MKVILSAQNLFYSIEGNSLVNLFAKKSNRDFRFLFDPALASVFPSFIRLMKNFYQQNDLFFENAIQINLKSITQKPILDVWVQLLGDHVTLYMLLQNVHPNVDLQHYSIKNLSSEIVKFTLSRQRLHAILRKKEALSEREPIVFHNSFLYNHIMQNCSKMIVLNEMASMFCFLTPTSISFMTNNLAHVLTWNQLENTHLLRNLNQNQIFFMNSESDSILSLEIKILPHSIIFYINGKTLNVIIKNSFLSFFYCEQFLKIHDFDFTKNLALVVSKNGENYAQQFQHKMIFEPTEFSQFISIEVLEETPLQFSGPGLEHFFIINGKKTATLINDQHFSIIELKNSFFTQKKNTKLSSISKIFKTSNFRDFDLLYLDENNHTFGLNLDNKNPVPIFEDKFEFSQQSVIIDPFFTDDLLLISNSSKISILNKDSQNLIASIDLQMPILKIKLIKNVVLVLLANSSIELLSFNEDVLLKLELPSDFTSIVDFDTHDLDLLLLYPKNLLQFFNLTETGFVLSYSFLLDDFNSVIYDSLQSELNDFRRLTQSISNLAVNLPKMLTPNSELANKITFFHFQNNYYLVLNSTQGFLYVYICYFSSLVRVAFNYPISPKGFSPLSNLTSLVETNFVLLNIENSTSIKLWKDKNRDSFQAAFKKKYTDCVLTPKSSIAGLFENEIDELCFSDGCLISPVQFKGKIKRIISLVDIPVKNTTKTETITLVNSFSNIEQLQVLNSQGNLLQTLCFQPNQTITTLKDLSSAFSDSSVVLFVGYLTDSPHSSDRIAKWQMVHLELSQESSLVCSLNITLDQTAQEKDRAISECFNFGPVIFVCLDDKLLRIEQNKLIRIYELNLLSVSHVAINAHSLLLADPSNTLSFFFWHHEKSELIEQSSSVIEGGIRTLAFLKEQLMRVR